MLQMSNKYKHLIIFLSIVLGVYISKYILLFDFPINTQQLPSIPLAKQSLFFLALLSIIIFIPKKINKFRFLLISILIGNSLFLINNLGPNIYTSSIIEKLDKHHIEFRGQVSEIKVIGFNTKKITLQTFSLKPIFSDKKNNPKEILLNSSFIFIKMGAKENISLYDSLIVIGDLETFKSPKNIYERDYKDFVFNKYISAEIKDPLILQHKKLETFNVLVYIDNFKKAVEDIFDKYLSIKNSGFVKAIILGEKSGLEVEVKNNFIQSGVLHLLAVSGLHVGFLFIFITLLLKKILVLGEKSFLLLTSTIIISYMFLTGLSPSVIRAGLMVLIFLVSNPLKRKLSPYDILATSGIISILIDSNQVFSVGFKLTFLAVFSIIFIFKKLNKLYLDSIAQVSDVKLYYYKILLNKDSFIYKYIIVTILLSLSISFGTLPLIMYEFGRLNLFSILLNVFLIPLTAISFTLAFIVLLTSYISSIFTLFIAFLLENINSMIFWLIDQKDMSELLTFNYKFNIIESLTVALFIIFFLFYKHRIIKSISVALISFCLLYFTINNNYHTLDKAESYTFNIRDGFNKDSKGNNKIITTNLGENILILNSKIKKNDLRNIIFPYLHNTHINTIDFLIFLDKSNKFQKKIDILNFFETHNRSEFNISVKNIIIFNEDKNSIGEFTIFNKEYLPNMYKETNFIDMNNISYNLKLLNSRIHFKDIYGPKTNLSYEFYDIL